MKPVSEKAGQTGVENLDGNQKPKTWGRGGLFKHFAHLIQSLNPQIRSAKIIDKQVHDIIGSDVPWGRNRLVVKYTLSRLKSDIKSRVIRLSASPPVNTPTMGAKGGGALPQCPDS